MILKKIASALQVKVVDFFLEPETRRTMWFARKRRG